MKAQHFLIKGRHILKLTRPITVLWFSGLTNLGFATVILKQLPDSRFIYWILTGALANVSAIIVNDLSDIKTDTLSKEVTKKSRPITSGAISKKEAIIICVIFYIASIFVSLIYGLSATLYAITIGVASILYSLHPFKMCGRPLASILFWIFLCIVCFVLLSIGLENINSRASIHFSNSNLKNSHSIIFMLGILTFMGIAEIISKDIRDMENDFHGGRNTFVNFAGINKATIFMIIFAFIGLFLWIWSFSLSDRLSMNIYAWLCSILGLAWCIKLLSYRAKLVKLYDQSVASRLHINWIVVYSLMIVFTILSYI